jgi:hypothetical protein
MYPTCREYSYVSLPQIALVMLRNVRYYLCKIRKILNSETYRAPTVCDNGFWAFIIVHAFVMERIWN